MKERVRVACAAVLFGACGLAVAGAAPTPEQVMAENDKDKNGEITQAEAAAAGTMLKDSAPFERVDTNKDGKITMDELRAMARSISPG